MNKIEAAKAIAQRANSQRSTSGAVRCLSRTAKSRDVAYEQLDQVPVVDPDHRGFETYERRRQNFRDRAEESAEDVRRTIPGCARFFYAQAPAGLQELTTPEAVEARLVELYGCKREPTE